MLLWISIYKYSCEQKFSFLLGKYLETTESHFKNTLNFKLFSSFPIRLYHLAFVPATYESSNCSTSYQHFCVLNVVNFSHSRVYEVLSCCDSKPLIYFLLWLGIIRSFVHFLNVSFSIVLFPYSRYSPLSDKYIVSIFFLVFVFPCLSQVVLGSPLQFYTILTLILTWNQVVINLPQYSLTRLLWMV